METATVSEDSNNADMTLVRELQQNSGAPTVRQTATEKPDLIQLINRNKQEQILDRNIKAMFATPKNICEENQDRIRRPKAEHGG